MDENIHNHLKYQEFREEKIINKFFDQLFIVVGHKNNQIFQSIQTKSLTLKERDGEAEQEDESATII